MANQDAYLKREIKQVLESCGLEQAVIDREVQLNWTGQKDLNGDFASDREFDVIARFRYRSQIIMLFFECATSGSAKGLLKEYRACHSDIDEVMAHLENVQVIASGDGQLKGRHFKDVEMIRMCFSYGEKLSDASYRTCLSAAKSHSFLVWNRLALTYYLRISSVLGRWSKYELFKDFGLNLEGTSSFHIDALEVKQKGKKMYVGKIHPGQLLKIAYVVRRASEKTFAYQRLLSAARINAIRAFVTSNESQAFLPNAVIAVFDKADGLHYSTSTHKLTIPLDYCSAWIIDGQHRVYGFVGTPYEKWEEGKFRPFELPIILFPSLQKSVQTQTFVNINYYQKKIKSELLCDLTTLTMDLRHKLTWPSLIGHELNTNPASPLKDRVRISELHTGRPIGLASLVQYGLLETLLGYKQATGSYAGPLFKYASFDPKKSFRSAANQASFQRHCDLLMRYLRGVRAHTSNADPTKDPWRNIRTFALLRPTGLNALFMVLAKILQKHPTAHLDFDTYLHPLSSAKFTKDYVAAKGGGWKGFRNFANTMIERLNSAGYHLEKYGKKQKV